MVERLVSFASADGESYGAVALEANGATAVLVGPGGTGGLDEASFERGDGSVRIRADSGELVLGLAAQTSQLGFETGEGREVRVQAVGASAELAAGAEASIGSAGFEATGVSWALDGEADQAVLRTLWAALGDGSLLVLFGLRAPGDGDHGGETVGAARIAKDGAVSPFAEPLLSTEYDAEGRQTRATLELWGDEQGGLPTRGGGSRLAGGSGRLGAATLDAARFRWSVDGVGGFGGYEVFRA